MYILGVWDGHESGAALIEGNKIVYAANEERFTRRKMEIKFPFNSIRAALDYAKLKPDDIEHITYTTTELTKTLERILPYMKESYYQFRRRKMLKPRFENFRHNLKYTLTGIGIVPGSGAVSSYYISKNLKHLGLRKFKLHIVEHHVAHAATAAFTSGFSDALIATVDGLGDGKSGSISTFRKGKLERHTSIKVRDSIGIFYEQVTNILGMRELEDEGKIMAMADYSYPFEFEDNKLKDFFKVEGTEITAKYSPLKQFEMLQRISWQTPREQFAYMAQQLLEKVLSGFVQNAVDRFGIGDIALAGGTFSNVKANMMIRKLDGVKHWYVFPHMGDGGMALGGALYTNYLLNGVSSYDFNAYLGNEYTEDGTETELRSYSHIEMQHETEKDMASHAADLINEGSYLFWFMGRMEYGPRALGNRSILAPSGSEEVKDKLNLYVKKREWFQPFAPSMLEEECGRLLKYDSKGAPKHMTMAYETDGGMADALKAVVHVDGTARPQAVGEENKAYRDMIGRVRRRTGYGVILNTSFNIHGEPIVMSPQDAIKTMKATKTRYMFINGLFVENKEGI